MLTRSPVGLCPIPIGFRGGSGPGVPLASHVGLGAECLGLCHQIWVVPARRGLEPTYDQRPVDRERAREEWVTLASGDPETETIPLARDVRLNVTLLSPGGTRVLELDPDREAWIHVARGATSLNGSPLAEGDGVAVSQETRLVFEGGDAELLAFDLA